jgi:hypothetical protein
MAVVESLLLIFKGKRQKAEGRRQKEKEQYISPLLPYSLLL